MRRELGDAGASSRRESGVIELPALHLSPHPVRAPVARVRRSANRTPSALRPSHAFTCLRERQHDVVCSDRLDLHGRSTCPSRDYLGPCFACGCPKHLGTATSLPSHSGRSRSLASHGCFVRKCRGSSPLLTPVRDHTKRKPFPPIFNCASYGELTRVPCPGGLGRLRTHHRLPP